eukprot:CAMPEP_0168431710 /NCGR_PEP_ID=MMETSP0228-20121227/38524_1 /TAXON_ID=133427 /ORGANISM="Protoceratium reticulatum, Strain CCCM 535 (=CCMP 1889)" /LENGTH=97 /DNA_ID=CAMNT_0008445831 /DNA_START=195 /DNA_END=485 /DNA_ORIENTATION=+
MSPAPVGLLMDRAECKDIRRPSAITKNTTVLDHLVGEGAACESKCFRGDGIFGMSPLTCTSSTVVTSFSITASSPRAFEDRRPVHHAEGLRNAKHPS